MQKVRKLHTTFGQTTIAFEDSESAVRTFIDHWEDRSPTAIITDPHILSCHPWIKDYASIYTIPQGEEAKSFDHISHISEQLIRDGLGRNVHLLAFGGGAVCDFVGFLASIYKRGVSYSLIPTTLLAQVDAAIGGKNGINLGDKKNMLGTFNAPDQIVIAPVLALSQDELKWRCGLAEVVKHAMVKDADFFYFLEENKKDIIEQSLPHINEMTWRAAQIKIDIVEGDPKEDNLRKLLNFGHTIGHAIERQGNYEHGEAVSIGMVEELQWMKSQNLSQVKLESMVSLLNFMGLPVAAKMDSTLWLDLIQADKKVRSQTIDMIIVKDIGDATIKEFDLGPIVKYFKDRSNV